MGMGSTCGGVTPPVDGSDRYLAPDGLLCAWSNFDGRTTNVWYTVPVADPNVVGTTAAHQVGWVAGPGGPGTGVNTQLKWVTDGNSALLRGVQLPLGHDAQAKATLSELDTQWRVNYDGNGRVASVVSPKPGIDQFVAGADTDRRARLFEYQTDPEGDTWTQVFHGVLADQDDPTQVTKGASLIDEVRYDAAWRPTRYAIVAAGGRVLLHEQDVGHDQ